jgi:hypothetical protein
MPAKGARSAEAAANEAYRVAEMRRKTPTGRVNREARVDAKAIQRAVEHPRRAKAKKAE